MNVRDSIAMVSGAVERQRKILALIETTVKASPNLSFKDLLECLNVVHASIDAESQLIEQISEWWAALHASIDAESQLIEQISEWWAALHVEILSCDATE